MIADIDEAEAKTPASMLPGTSPVRPTLQASPSFPPSHKAVPYVHDANPRVPALKPSGTRRLVAYLGPMAPFLNSTMMIMGRHSIAGSLIGGTVETQKSDVNYRFVIDMATLNP